MFHNLSRHDRHSFSLKKTLRNAVRQERLSGLVILCRKNVQAEKLDLEQIVEDLRVHNHCVA